MGNKWDEGNGNCVPGLCVGANQGRCSVRALMTCQISAYYLLIQEGGSELRRRAKEASLHAAA